MGIMETVLNDWRREQMIKKHRKEIHALEKKQAGHKITRITPAADTEKHCDNRTSSEISGVQSATLTSETAAVEKETDCMGTCDQNGELDAGLSQYLMEKELEKAVIAICRVCQSEKKTGGLDITCTQDGQNVHICVKDGDYTVGKWRYQPQTDTEKDPSIHLYHLNYNYNRAPGPNFHFQQQAKGLYTPEDVAVYILRHDKKKSQNDREKRQSECDQEKHLQPDDLIGE